MPPKKKAKKAADANTDWHKAATNQVTTSSDLEELKALKLNLERCVPVKTFSGVFLGPRSTTSTPPAAPCARSAFGVPGGRWVGGYGSAKSLCPYR